MGKNYKKAYYRFLHSEAWRQTKIRVLKNRRKKWEKKGYFVPNNMFLCDSCKKLKHLSSANYHHISYNNKYGGDGWANHKNVILVCRMCHEWIHRNKIKKKNKEEYRRIMELRKISKY
jgi:hypothetical protein